MRTDVQLLKLVLEKLDKTTNLTAGLCYFVRQVRVEKELIDEEFARLDQIIEKNKPNVFTVFNIFCIIHYLHAYILDPQYYYTQSYIWPRKAYLRHLIRVYKKYDNSKEQYYV